MQNEVVDLFNNTGFKKQFESLPESEKKAFKDAGEYMYSKDYTDVKAGEHIIDEAVGSLRRAFKAGLLPTDLSEEEIRFLEGVYGDKWYEEFGFSSLGVSEKKTTKMSRLAEKHKKDFSDIVLSDVLVNPNTKVSSLTVKDYPSYTGIVDTSEASVEDYDNRDSGFIYTTWS